MRAVEFDAVEAGSIAANRRRDEVGDQFLGLLRRKTSRSGLGVVGRAHRRLSDQIGW